MMETVFEPVRNTPTRYAVWIVSKSGADE
jgi:hypothetical protein